jgi:hypothetical protein
MALKIIRCKVFRIGKQCLFKRDGKYFVSISNRTHYAIVQIPASKVFDWIRALE